MAPDFERIVAETHSRVRAYIAGMGVPLDEVDDVAQDVYLDFHASPAVPQGVEMLRWLKGMAKKRCLNYFRRRKDRGREALAEILSRVESTTPVDPPSDKLARCLERVTERSRAIVAMRYEQGLASDAIAQALGTTAGAIRIALLRIRSELRTCLEQSAP